MPGKYDRLKRVGPNLYREDGTDLYFARKKIAQRKYWHRLETTNRAEAEKQRDSWIRKLEESGGIQKPGWRDITLQNICERARIQSFEQKSKSYEHVSSNIRTLLRYWPGGGDVQFSRITASHCRDFFLCVRRRNGATISAGYFVSLLHTAKEIFAAAKLDGYRIDDPMAEANIQIPARDKIYRVTPSMKEFRAILDYVVSNPFNRRREQSADMIEFAGLFGLGNAEIETLKWGQIDYLNKKLNLIRIKTSEPFEVPIYPWCFSLLNKLRAKAEAHGGRGTAPETKLFTSEMPSVALRSACRALALPNFTPRAVRRLFIYHCCWAGVSCKTVAELQGHSDGGKMIREIYDNASSSSDKDREGEELERRRVEVKKASKYFGETGVDLRAPEGLPAIAEVPAEVNLEVRLAAAKAILDRKNEDRKTHLKKTSFGNPEQLEALTVLQPELKSLNGNVGLIVASVMRKIKSDEHDELIEAVISGGNLQNRAKRAHADVKAANRKLKAVRVYSKEVAEKAQNALLRQHELDAMRTFAESDTRWGHLKEALKRVRSRSRKIPEYVG